MQSVGLQLPSDTTELGSKTSIQERRENVKRYSIDPNFGGKISAWDRAGRPEGERFTLGSTGPVLILKSRNAGRGARGNSRVVLFGTLKAQDGRPILCVLDLRSKERGFPLNDMQKVTSAYTKDNNPRAFLQNSDVMFLDKKRTTRLLSEIGFQTPISCNRSGYVGTIAYARDAVKLEGEPFSQ